MWPREFPKAVLPCPVCQSDKHVQNKGWRTPRRIIGLEDVQYFAMRQYQCRSDFCGKKWFTGAHKDVVNQFPKYIKENFPVVLTHKSGVTRKLADLLLSSGQASEAPSIGGVHEMLETWHLGKYYSLRARFLSRSHCGRFEGQTSLEFNTRAQQFSSFSDPEGYAVFVPSTSFLHSVLHEILCDQEPWLDKMQQMTDGQILYGDANYKWAKLIWANGVQCFDALYTLMNEVNQVVKQELVQDSENRCLKQGLHDIAGRQQYHGMAPVELVFVDNCCHARSSILEALPGLASCENEREAKSGSCRGNRNRRLKSLEFPQDDVGTPKVGTTISQSITSDAYQPVTFSL